MSKITIETIRHSIMAALQPYESFLLRNSSYEEAPPPCFIIGSPRSGTTLIYEALLVRFTFSYFSNIADRFFYSPASATRLGNNILKKRVTGSFRSTYGQLKGWTAPSEGGRVWNRWIPQSSYLPPDHAQRLPISQIRNTVASISKSMNAPFVNKNVMHSVHMDVLDRIFPGCYFIEIRRDPSANIRSIVRAREKNGGPKEEHNWWSVKPRDWKTYERASIEEQACAQVYCLKKDIAISAANLPPSRFHTVDYEDFCRYPMDILTGMRKFIEKNIKCELKENSVIPRQFSIQPSQLLAPEPEKIISDWANIHYKQ